jgi:hypothetical protein
MLTLTFSSSAIRTLQNVLTDSHDLPAPSPPLDPPCEPHRAVTTSIACGQVVPGTSCFCMLDALFDDVIFPMGILGLFCALAKLPSTWYLQAMVWCQRVGMQMMACQHGEYPFLRSSWLKLFSRPSRFKEHRKT